MIYLLACSDYALEGKDEGGDPFDSGTDFTHSGSTAEDTADSVPVTEPEECDLPAPELGLVPTLEACEGDVPIEVTDPWNVHIEWTYDSGGTGVIVMPAIGNLTDDDGDGDVDEDDDPDVAFTEWSGYLTAVDGPTGTELFRLSGYNGNAGVSIADVTGDGFPEVIALSTSSRIDAIAGDGSKVWSSAAISGLATYPQPTIADLENDGDAEVIFDNVVLDGPTGAEEARLTSGLTTSWRTPVVADLDLDGQREILLGNVTFSPTGAQLWRNGGSGAGDFAAVADIDGDPEGEALFVSGSQLLLYDSDGTMLDNITIPGSNPGPPAVADFDGDGEVEIAIPANTTISLYEMSGTRVWSSTMQDNSGLAGCSGYDVNGDGAYEVLFADELALRIYDGSTGTILYEDGNHDSQTLWEYPVVADVDHDGSAEIAVADNRYHGGPLGVTIFGHDGDGWPKSGPTWGTHDFAVTNLGQDGSVPTGEDPSWQVHNVFRARPAVDEPGAADLYPDLGEICITGCAAGDVVQFSWSVANQGAVESEATTVTLFGSFGGSERELASAPVPALSAGELGASGVFTLDALEIAGADQFRLRLADGGTECDESNDESLATTLLCP